MDGYTSPAKYKAAISVTDFVGKIFATDEKAMFDGLLASLRAKPALQPVEFKAIVTAWMAPFKPATGDSEYLFCTNKNCAVWQLFHAISILIAIKYTVVTAAEAVPEYRFMVDNFLSCTVCKQHFLLSYDGCLFGRCDVLGAANPTPDLQSKALVLWLWRLHNAVSTRVLKEQPALSQGGSVDRRFPAYRDCPSCWNPTVVQGQKAPLLKFTGQKTNDQPVYDIFNVDNVYEFLKKEFLGEGAKRLYEESSTRLPSNQSPVTRTLALSVCLVALFAMVSLVRRHLGQRRVSSEEDIRPMDCQEESVE
jgi:hypothetical protein